MKIDEIKDWLPLNPPRGMMSWIEKNAGEQLGPPMTIFCRESVEINLPTWDELETAESIDRKLGQIKRVWAARCDCSECMESWYAGFYKDMGGARGVVCLSPDAVDGDVYVDDPILIEGRVAKIDDEGAIFFPEGDHMTCPCCGAETRLVHRSSLRRGRTWQTQVVSLHNIMGFSVLMYWMVRRSIDQDGIWTMDCRPREALVIGLRGGLTRFSRTNYGDIAEGPAKRWSRRETANPEAMPFYSYDSGKGRKTIGSWVYPCPADMTGTTGEKTGIEDWIREGRCDASVYLGIWRENPNVENLVKAGWAYVLEAEIGETIERQMEYDSMYCHMSVRYLSSVDIPWIFWNEVKPHRMLGMSKEEMRLALQRRLPLRAIELWCTWEMERPGTLTAGEFLEGVKLLGWKGMETLMGAEADGWGDFDLRRVLRYLGGQGDLYMDDAAQIFVDYRTMLLSQAMDLGLPLEQLELWPRNLQRAHDRLSEIRRAAKEACYEKDFAELKALYAPLEWTDGELCIVVPGSPEDLQKEGASLDHCVGGYSGDHRSGRPIFFVRRYRRPERSYYTLNENLQKMKPSRIQLHGYGNEWHTDAKGKRKRHQIPQKVMDFVDRWEREILAPWYAAYRRQVLEEERSRTDASKKKKKKKKEAHAA